MKPKIRVGIIGAGFGARVHVPIIKDHPGFEVISISSVSRSQTEDIKKETGLEKVYSHWIEMLEKEELDLVSVVSAPFLHHEMVIEAFKRKRHVLCEKPMAFNASEAEWMLKAKNKAQYLGFINFEFRFLPARLKVKEIMESGQLGRIMHIHYTGIYQGYNKNFQRKYWLGEKEKGGGMLGALGSHMFDSLLWLKNVDIGSLYGQLPIHFPEFVDQNGEVERRTAEDAFQVIGEFVDGTTFTVDFILSSRNTSGWRLEVFGTEGTLRMTDDQSVYVGYGDEPINKIELLPEIKAPDDLSDYSKRYYPSFYPMLDHLYQAVALKKISSKLATFEDGLRVQAILDAVRISAEEGRRLILS